MKVLRPTTNNLVRGYLSYHHGYDFSGRGDQNIYACNSGKIIQRVDKYNTSWRNTGTLSTKDYGNYIKLAHDTGGYSLYAHLHPGTLTSGRVKEGEVIAKVGNTGNSTAKHLHFELRNKINRSIPAEFKESMEDGLQKVLDHFKVKSAEELYHKVDEDLTHLANARKEIPKLRETIQAHETEIERLRSEVGNLNEDIKREVGACDDRVKSYKAFVDRLGEALGTEHKTEAIEAEIKRMVELENQLKDLRKKYDEVKLALIEKEQNGSKFLDNVSDLSGSKVSSEKGVLRALERLLAWKKSIEIANIKQKEASMAKKKVNPEWMSGYKTYIVAGLVGAVVLAHQLGWLSPELANTILGILGAGGLITLRMGVKKAE